MSIWEILGIAQTDDADIITKAYSERVKECQPEEKPEEFQQLLAAYRSAMSSAQYHGTAIFEPEEFNQTGRTTDPAVSQNKRYETDVQADHMDYEMLIGKGIGKREEWFGVIRSRVLKQVADKMKMSYPAEDLAKYLEQEGYQQVKNDPQFIKELVDLLQKKGEFFSPDHVRLLYESYHFNPDMSYEQSGYYDLNNTFHALLCPKVPPSTKQTEQNKAMWKRAFIIAIVVLCVLRASWSYYSEVLRDRSPKEALEKLDNDKEFGKILEDQGRQGLEDLQQNLPGLTPSASQSTTEEP